MSILTVAEQLVHENPAIRMATMESARAYRKQISIVRNALYYEIAELETQVKALRMIARNAENDTDYDIADKNYQDSARKLYALKSVESHVLGLIYF